MRHSGFEFSDETYCVLYSPLGIGAEGPVAQTEPPPDKIDERIEREQKLIAKLPCERKPLHSAAAGHHDIEFVTVNNQNALARCGDVNCVFPDRNISVGTTKAGHQFVVISWNVDHACAFARFTQNFLDHVVMLLRPVNSASQRPDIDQVANDI